LRDVSVLTLPKALFSGHSNQPKTLIHPDSG
jgi:hypothetical protein